MGANAGTAVPVYASGQVLDAARLNLTNCGVPVFSGTANRDAAFGGSGEKVLAEGQLCYVEDLTGVAQIQYYDGAAWVSLVGSGLIQVKNAIKTDTFTASVATGAKTAITGISVSITPTSASNKILVMAMLTAGVGGGTVGQYYTLKRGATEIAIGDAAGNRQRVTNGTIGDTSAQAGESLISASLIALDSPATTSATTYSVDISHASGSTQTVYINRSLSDGNFDYIARGVSTITVFEVIP